MSDGAQRPVDDEEFSWLAFGGSDDVSITSLATAGSQSIAVGGSGGKLEIWDMEAVSRDGGRTQKGARAGLVRRLVSTGVHGGIAAQNWLDSTGLIRMYSPVKCKWLHVCSYFIVYGLFCETRIFVTLFLEPP